jgi:hypothetical protein
MGDEMVDVEGLEASLQDLIKAADATSIAKAYGGTSVEYSGRYDEDGKGGGGGAESGDIGGLDDMMIGKLSEAGIPADVISAFSAFMSKEEEEEKESEGGGDEEEEEEEEGEEGKMSAHKKGKFPPEPEFEGKMGKVSHGRPTAKSQDYDLQKSMQEFRGDRDIADAIDVSPFLEALTARTAEQLDGIRKSHGQFANSQADVNRAMAGAIYQMGSIIKSMGQRLGVVERTPATPRGATRLTGAQAMAKSMPGEVGSGRESLSKSELLASMSYMNLEKGIKQINGRSTAELVSLFEGGANIDQGTVGEVEKFLRSHPNESDTARRYS